jgi:ATP-dependent RNA helicase DDX54/DBP10
MTETASFHRPEVKGGSFKTMGLSSALQKGILRKGYLNPTPIQRKSIPFLLHGQDVIAMARTGSGKTAAFAIPIIHRLRSHCVKIGVRALVLSPTRELACQSSLVIQQLSKYTDIRTVCIVGGDPIEEQFSLLATNPDIVVATPGRLVHLCLEAKLGILQTAEFFVLDEADRMFEMGFSLQVSQIIALMNKEVVTSISEASAGKVNRQCALFSATLPNQVAEFTRIGLVNPVVIRLDADGKLSPDLKTLFFHSRSEFKESVLIYILQNLSAVVNFHYATQAMIFVATRHHAEYLAELIGNAFGMNVGSIYGTMDQEARDSMLDQFRHKEIAFLFVTDVAARGLDIPLLDVVINYDFPAKPKLLVHRVGRVARNGRPGAAISLLSPDEVPYFLDLKLFVGDEPGFAIGHVPQPLLDEISDTILKKKALCMGTNFDDLRRVMTNATKMYCSTRPSASPESYERSKLLTIPTHAFFQSLNSAPDNQVLSAIHAYKRHQNLLNITEIKVRGASLSAKFSHSNESEKGSAYLGYKPSKSSLLSKAFAIEDSILDIRGDEHRLKKFKHAEKMMIKNADSKLFGQWRKKNQGASLSVGAVESKSCKEYIASHIERRKKTRVYLSRRKPHRVTKAKQSK